jgi:glycosyltransferase involved in cell wall biosynthesis
MKLLWVLYCRVLEGHSHLSGSERIERLSYLSREGIQTYLLTGNFDKRLYHQKEKNLHIISIPLKYIPIVTPILYGLTLFFFLPYYIVKIRPDFIISDQTTTLFLIWKPLLSRLADFKMTLDIRTTPLTTSRRSLMQMLRVLAFNLAIWAAKTMFDGMTIVTPMMKEEICQVFGLRSEWVGVLPNGISDDFLKCQEKDGDIWGLRQKLGLSNRFVIIYHGSLRLHGGLLESVEAVRLAKNDHPDILLFLLGQGFPQTLSILRKAIETNRVQNNVILHGPVDFHSVPDYISMSDIGLVPLPNIPIWRYQQPLKLLEYLAMGKPIIAIDSPAHRNVAGANRNVVYVRDLNSNELAKAMIYAYENRDKLKDWGRSGQQVIVEKYVWKKVNEDLISYLMRI